MFSVFWVWKMISPQLAWWDYFSAKHFSETELPLCTVLLPKTTHYLAAGNRTGVNWRTFSGTSLSAWERESWQRTPTGFPVPQAPPTSAPRAWGEVTAAHTCALHPLPAPAQSGRAENGPFLSQIPKESKLCKICGRTSCFSYPRRGSAPPTHPVPLPFPSSIFLA